MSANENGDEDLGFHCSLNLLTPPENERFQVDPKGEASEHGFDGGTQQGFPFVRSQYR